MKIEHMAWQVEDPAAAAAWYVEHLRFEIRRGRGDAAVPFFFLADQSGAVMIEIYRNPAAPVPDYRAMDPLVLHLALVSDDVAADRERLLNAGAIAVSHETTPAGDEVAMLRDPWGFPIQLCRRAEPMLGTRP